MHVGARDAGRGLVFGTRADLSPEPAGAEPDVDGRADVSAGLFMFEALTERDAVTLALDAP